MEIKYMNQESKFMKESVGFKILIGYGFKDEASPR